MPSSGRPAEALVQGASSCLRLAVEAVQLLELCCAACSPVTIVRTAKSEWHQQRGGLKEFSDSDVQESTESQ